MRYGFFGNRDDYILSTPEENLLFDIGAREYLRLSNSGTSREVLKDYRPKGITLFAQIVYGIAKYHYRKGHQSTLGADQQIQRQLFLAYEFVYEVRVEGHWDDFGRVLNEAIIQIRDQFIDEAIRTEISQKLHEVFLDSIFSSTGALRGPYQTASQMVGVISTQPILKCEDNEVTDCFLSCGPIPIYHSFAEFIRKEKP